MSRISIRKFKEQKRKRRCIFKGHVEPLHFNTMPINLRSLTDCSYVKTCRRCNKILKTQLIEDQILYQKQYHTYKWSPECETLYGVTEEYFNCFMK